MTIDAATVTYASAIARDNDNASLDDIRRANDRQSEAKLAMITKMLEEIREDRRQRRGEREARVIAASTTQQSEAPRNTANTANDLIRELIKELREDRLERAARRITAATARVAAAVTTTPVDMAATAPVEADLAEAAATTAAPTVIFTMPPTEVATIPVIQTETAVSTAFPAAAPTMAAVPTSETVATSITLRTEKAATPAALPTEPTATSDTSCGPTLVIKNKASRGSRDDITVARNAHNGDNIARNNRNAVDAHVSASRKQLLYRPFPISKLPVPVDTGLIRLRRKRKRHKDADAGDHIAHCGALRNNGRPPCTTPKSMINKAALASTPITTVRLKGVGGFGPSIDGVATFDLWSTLRDSLTSVFSGNTREVSSNGTLPGLPRKCRCLSSLACSTIPATVCL
ncbi:hypothetical protein SEPCBS119000_005267 [Sporothrix epigloea]|uniref:Uncharacterized protein n=1 Tax=Sporothrix epigloea TaxID=1892477 RepID=A0ABP0DWM3_9PEZI